MIQKAILKEGGLLEKSRFAPYPGYTVFIIDECDLIFKDEIITDFDLEYHKDIFNIIETVE